MDKADNGEINTYIYSFEILSAIDEMVPKIVQENVDIAAVPANLSSVLYNNTQGDIHVLAINTLGMMYILESGDTISSIEDLRGKTILASGKGGVVEFALNYILTENGIDPETDLTIEWKSEHTECVIAFTTIENAIAVLPQPFVTIALRSDEEIRIALDLNQEWDKLQDASDNPSSLITGVVIVRKEFAAEHPEVVADFLQHYNASVDFVNSNIDEAAALVGQYDIVPEPVAQMAIPYCNIVFIEGQEMREKLSGYLEVLYNQNPQSVGGTLPSDEYYYIR
jgi:NitT/TauT family transport system substrate-binding protein